MYIQVVFSFLHNVFCRKRNQGIYGSNFNSILNDFSELTDKEFPGIKRSDDELLKQNTDGDENILDSKIFRLLTFFPHHELEEFTVSQNVLKKSHYLPLRYSYTMYTWCQNPKFES